MQKTIELCGDGSNGGTSIDNEVTKIYVPYAFVDCHPTFSSKVESSSGVVKYP